MTLSEITIRTIDGEPVVAVALDAGDPYALTCRHEAARPLSPAKTVVCAYSFTAAGPRLDIDGRHVFATKEAAEQFIASWLADFDAGERRVPASAEECERLMEEDQAQREADHAAWLADAAKYDL